MSRTEIESREQKTLSVEPRGPLPEELGVGREPIANEAGNLMPAAAAGLSLTHNVQ